MSSPYRLPNLILSLSCSSVAVTQQVKFKSTPLSNTDLSKLPFFLANLTEQTVNSCQPKSGVSKAVLLQLQSMISIRFVHQLHDLQCLQLFSIMEMQEWFQDPGSRFDIHLGKSTAFQDFLTNFITMPQRAKISPVSDTRGTVEIHPLNRLFQ